MNDSILEQQGHGNSLPREDSKEALAEGQQAASCFYFYTTSDVAQSKLTEGQNDRGGFSFPGGHALLSGQMVLPRVPHELYAFWNRNLHVDLEELSQMEAANPANTHAII